MGSRICGLKHEVLGMLTLIFCWEEMEETKRKHVRSRKKLNKSDI